MTKVLLKKQMMEVFSWIYRDKKTETNRSKNGIIGFILLYLLLFAFLGSAFFMAASMLCEPLLSVNYGWLYFAIMGMISVAFGVFGSVFNTYASLYQAKDNDFLLSMPVTTTKILFVRLFGVYITGLMYELIVMIPTVIVWFINAPINVAMVIFTLLIPFVLSIFILSLSAVLGWVVALISGRIKNNIVKNMTTVILSLAFITAYYYCYAQSSAILESIIANPQMIGDGIKNILYPIYHMGLAAQGNVLSMLIFTAIIAALFVIVYLVLSHTFLKLATTNRGASKKKYKHGNVEARSVGKALLSKEFRRFVGSTNYMLNCGLGIILMVIAAVALLIKGDYIVDIMNEILPGGNEIIYLIGTAAICMLTTMNDITAPSVSLEGKNLWLLQVSPVSGTQALMAKLKLHLILTFIPTAILTAAVEWVLTPSIGFAVMIPVTAALFIVFMAAFGLFVNLKMPNLNWTNEVVPIKQSAAAMIALFGGWVAVAALSGAYWGLSGIISPLVFIICTASLLLALSIVLIYWIRTKGARIFETL